MDVFDDRNGLPFQALEFVRYDRCSWPLEKNAASLPTAILSNQAVLNRINKVAFVKPMDAGCAWTWQGRLIFNCILVCFEVSVNTVFAVVRRPDALQSPTGPSHGAMKSNFRDRHTGLPTTTSSNP